jgi:hypothetical protein
MGTKEKHGAKGNMILNHDWFEDSQGISEYYNQCANLEADPTDDSFVVLTIEDGKYDPRKSKRQSKKVIKIATAELISLIEKHGLIM